MPLDRHPIVDAYRRSARGWRMNDQVIEIVAALMRGETVRVWCDTRLRAKHIQDRVQRMARAMFPQQDGLLAKLSFRDCEDREKQSPPYTLKLPKQ